MTSGAESGKSPEVRRRVACLGLLAGLSACNGCSGDGRGTGAIDASAPVVSSATPRATKDPERKVVLDFANKLEDCWLGHRGLLVDLGDPKAHARLTRDLDALKGDDFEREGASWLRAKERSLAIPFVWSEEPKGEPVVIEARVRGGAARTIGFLLDGRPAGSASLVRGETRTITLKSQTAQLAAGANELVVQLSGGKPQGEVLADIDWIRVGPWDSDAPYAAPTREEAVTSPAIGGVSRRALSLRPQSFARCTGFVPKGARLDASLALSGGGEADVEVRLLADRQAPQVLATARLGRDDGAAWKPLGVALPDLDTAAAVEFTVTRATKGTRVLVGDAAVTAPRIDRGAAPSTRAKGVVLVVLGSTGRAGLSTYGGARVLPELDGLAKAGLVFEDHRSTSSLASAAVASMLTGLGPRGHGVVDAGSALPRALVTAADAARQGGVATAMFTANPLTYSAFGFSRGFDAFGTHVPMDDAPATKVFDLAAKFVADHKADRFFVVVHARGAHPPWDVGAEDVKGLPPQGYTGGLEPRHAGELLAKAKKTPPTFRFGEPDRARAAALAERAMLAHDEGLGRLLAAIRAAGRAEDTAVIVTSDAASDEAQHVPWGESDAVDEPALAVPLVIRAPGLAPGRAAPPTDAADVAPTILGLFGLEAPATFKARSALERVTGEPRLRVASHGSRTSARLGPFVLFGQSSREVKLCSTALEPTCTTDVRVTHPIALELIHRLTYDELNGGAPPTPEPAPQDPLTIASLRAWGR